jgi:hypothetical protein
MIGVVLAAIRERTISWTHRTEADYHAIHIAGCVECASDDEWLGV